MKARELQKGMVIHHPLRDTPFPVTITLIKPSRNDKTKLSLHFSNNEGAVVKKKQEIKVVNNG